MLALNTDTLLIIIVSLTLATLVVGVLQQLRGLIQSDQIALQPIAIKKSKTHHGRGRPNERR